MQSRLPASIAGQVRRKGVDSTTKAKLDAALSRVREPQSGLSVVDLRYVTRISYSLAEKSIVVHMAADGARFECLACAFVKGTVRSSLERKLIEELTVEFPGFSIELQQAIRGGSGDPGSDSD